MIGLIIKKKWLDLIIVGQKRLEIRGSDTSKVNIPIYLLESGTHRIRGKCIINSTTLITKEYWEDNRNLHCVDISYEDLLKRYKTPCAWELTDVELIDDELFYNHPKGAVIWVKNILPVVNHVEGNLCH